MAKAKAKAPAKLLELELEDPDGVEWMQTAASRWDTASVLAVGMGGDSRLALELYDPPPLPDFRAKAPAHVTRELLGRFLQQRSTGIVHDVYAAKPECELDRIADATFYHFWSEVVDAIGEDVPCRYCLGA